MLDIRAVREFPEKIRADLEKRGEKEKLAWLKDLLEKDSAYRNALQKAEELKRKRNELSQKIRGLKKEKKNADALLRKAKKLPGEISDAEKKAEGLKKKTEFYRMRLPNILHESVPVGRDEKDNKEIRKWGKIPSPAFQLRHHGEILSSMGQADFGRAAKISGTGFYFLKNHAALLEMALIRFGLDLLLQKGFIFLSPPLMMKRKPYEGVTSLEDFENVMYKLEGEDLYLIATSEHPLMAMHSGEIFSGKELPLKYAGVSPCFRKEIGRHKIDERGLFRVHHFSKVEQTIICGPEESWKFHEELLKNAEEFVKALEIPYRVVNVCTGDIGIVAAKKYDIEAWSPRENAYFEVMSCSNCTSYQSVRLNLKYRKRHTHEKEFVHTLNSTMVAASRMLRAIAENFQTKEGTILIPKPLRPYMNGLKEIK